MRKLDWDFYSNNAVNIQRINHKGNTAIALAFTSEISEHHPVNFTFLCLLQLENSLQAGVRETNESVSERRIRSILLTGDRAETAARVGIECGITNDPKIYLTRRTIQYMALAEVASQSVYCSIFARLLPSQKAVLKAADIGISFMKNSSSNARRLSKNLINELADLFRLIEGSDRLYRRIGNLELIR